jgi:hypothetical protein
VIRLGVEFVDQILHHITQKVRQLPKIQQIIEYDKVLDKILGELGYQGTLADKLRQYQAKNILPQAVWDAHRERNKLVHEVGYELSHRDTDRHVVALEREVMRILQARRESKSIWV